MGWGYSAAAAGTVHDTRPRVHVVGAASVVGCRLTMTCRLHPPLLLSLRDILEASNRFVILSFAGLTKPK